MVDTVTVSDKKKLYNPEWIHYGLTTTTQSVMMLNVSLCLFRIIDHYFDWSFARPTAPVVQLSPPPPSSFASINTG